MGCLCTTNSKRSYAIAQSQQLQQQQKDTAAHASRNALKWFVCVYRWVCVCVGYGINCTSTVKSLKTIQPNKFCGKCTHSESQQTHMRALSFAMSWNTHTHIHANKIFAWQHICMNRQTPGVAVNRLLLGGGEVVVVVLPLLLLLFYRCCCGLYTLLLLLLFFHSTFVVVNLLYLCCRNFIFVVVVTLLFLLLLLLCFCCCYFTMLRWDPCAQS